MPENKFGELLKSLRKEKGETQETLGEKSGITYVAIGDWERGKRKPKRSSILSVAKALGVTPNPLLDAAGFKAEPYAVKESMLLTTGTQVEIQRRVGDPRKPITITPEMLAVIEALASQDNSDKNDVTHN